MCCAVGSVLRWQLFGKKAPMLMLHLMTLQLQRLVLSEVSCWHYVTIDLCRKEKQNQHLISVQNWLRMRCTWKSVQWCINEGQDENNGAPKPWWHFLWTPLHLPIQYIYQIKSELLYENQNFYISQMMLRPLNELACVRTSTLSSIWQPPPSLLY